MSPVEAVTEVVAGVTGVRIRGRTARRSSSFYPGDRGMFLIWAMVTWLHALK